MSQSSPRVLQVVLSLNPGGTERLVLELARRLHRQVPMAVCCLDDAGAWAPELTDAGVTVQALQRPSGFAPSLGRAVARLAAEHRATVLHCHHYSPFVYGALARLWRPNLRVVYTEHGRLSDAAPSTKRRLANTAFGKLPSAVFAVSSELRQQLVDQGFSSALAKVIYNGIDLGPVPDAARRAEIRRRLEVTDDTTVLATIARLDPVKDLATLIRAVSRLDERCVLLIIGDGPERESLTQEATAAGVAHRVRFLGHRNDARDWLAGSDLYVNTSISEGVSLTILEAMAAGLPVVATRVGGTPEVVDAASGRLAPAREPDRIAEVLTELIRDGELRGRMGAAARRRVETHFTLDRMVAEYRDVYETLT